uniref:Uncharacterized protein n=1 Tax=Oryza barthii TaxID=65489 RepID=A0A0D3EVU9_9ORYZ
MEMEMELLVGMWNLSATHDISGARCRVLGHAPEAVVEVDGVGLEVDVVERVGDVGGNLEARLPRREQGEGQEDRKEKNGSNGDATDKPGDCRDGDDGVGVGLDGSVAVVKQSDDPAGRVPVV